MKTTVNSIIQTAKTLQRFENYANRHMEKTDITQANDAIKVARDALKTANREFLDADVSALTVDVTREIRQLEFDKQRLIEVKTDIKDFKRKLADPTTIPDWEDVESVQDELNEAKEYKREIKMEIKELETFLN